MQALKISKGIGQFFLPVSIFSFVLTLRGSKNLSLQDGSDASCFFRRFAFDSSSEETEKNERKASTYAAKKYEISRWEVKLKLG